MPDGITQALQAIQPALKTGTEVADLGSTAYNMYNQYQNQQYQDKLRSMAQDPTKMNAYAAQFTQPLTAGLQANVANSTQGYLASHGLSDSPQISEQVQAQAIAPYIQQNQQAGYNNALQALNLGGGAVNPNSSSPNTIASLSKAFSMMGGPSKPGADPSAALMNYLRTMGTQPAQINQGQPGAAPGPIDTSGWDQGGMPDMSGMFPAAPAVASEGYTPDYTAGMDYGGAGSVSY